MAACCASGTDARVHAADAVVPDMNPTDFFKKKLGAALANRASWGAVRADGIVFLRVWQDEGVKRDGDQYVRVAAHSKYPKDSDDFGWNERLRHIDLIRNNAKCYLVMCITKDVNANPRAIKEFIDDRVFVGGAIVDDGDTWIGRGPPVNLDDVG